MVDLWKQEDPSLDCYSQPPESHQEFGDHKDDFGAYLTLIMSKDVQGGPIYTLVVQVFQTFLIVEGGPPGPPKTVDCHLHIPFLMVACLTHEVSCEIS